MGLQFGIREKWGRKSIETVPITKLVLLVPTMVPTAKFELKKAKIAVSFRYFSADSRLKKK